VHKVTSAQYPQAYSQRFAQKFNLRPRHGRTIPTGFCAQEFQCAVGHVRKGTLSDGTSCLSRAIHVADRAHSVENPPSGEPISCSSARISLWRPNEINALARSRALTMASPVWPKRCYSRPPHHGVRQSDSETGGPWDTRLHGPPLFTRLFVTKKAGLKLGHLILRMNGVFSGTR
jgi:hypothetical protein